MGANTVPVQNHRIIGYYNLEATHDVHWVSLRAPHRIIQNSNSMPERIFQMLLELGAVPTALGRLSHAHCSWRKGRSASARTKKHLVGLRCMRVHLVSKNSWDGREEDEREDFVLVNATNSLPWMAVLVFEPRRNSLISLASFVSWVNIDFFSFPCTILWLICF